MVIQYMYVFNHLYSIILLYYIIFHLTYIYYLFTICLKVAVVRLNWRGLACSNYTMLMEEVTVPAKGFF